MTSNLVLFAHAWQRPHPAADNTPEANVLRQRLLANEFFREGVVNPFLESRRLTKPIQQKLCPQFYWLWSPIAFPGGGLTYHSQVFILCYACIVICICAVAAWTLS